MPVKQTFKLSR